MGEQTSAEYLEKNIDETFTAYIKVSVSHLCYDPLISRQYFNVRVLRPINVAGKELKIKDIPNVMQRISIQDLIDIIDYRDIPVVGRNNTALAKAKTAFGVADAPLWTSTVKYSGTPATLVVPIEVAEQNAGLPYEYYGIKDLAVVYEEILSDHMAPKAFREGDALRTGSAIAAAVEEGKVKAVKDIQSLIGPLSNPVVAGAKVLSLYSNNAESSLKVTDTGWTLVSFTAEHAYSTGIGKIEYTNNSGVAQKFHIYVPIAVHYNWGNVEYGNTQISPAYKSLLDKDYTQVVWGVITVDPSYLGE
jgi:hypothetical protein